MRSFEKISSIKREERRKTRRSFSTRAVQKANKGQNRPAKQKALRVHPLFLLTGVWYACTGQLFLFLISALVAIQHELAHAYAAAKLGYTLNKIVLMPFGAVIDGDLQDISLKDEIWVALCGPLCNLVTALLFGALWWFAPTMYAFTDTAFFASMAIALVNLLPAYPLDGGRIFKCALVKSFLKNSADVQKAEKRGERICRFVTVGFSLLFLLLFIVGVTKKTPNFTLLTFAGFLLIGGFGNKDKTAVYNRMQFSQPRAMKKGMEIRYVALADSCPVKDVFRFLSNGSYLILVVYNEQEQQIGTISQNRLSQLFAAAPSPYTPLSAFFVYENTKK